MLVLWHKLIFTNFCPAVCAMTRVYLGLILLLWYFYFYSYSILPRWKKWNPTPKRVSNCRLNKQINLNLLNFSGFVNLPSNFKTKSKNVSKFARPSSKKQSLKSAWITILLIRFTALFVGNHCVQAACTTAHNTANTVLYLFRMQQRNWMKI